MFALGMKEECNNRVVNAKAGAREGMYVSVSSHIREIMLKFCRRDSFSYVDRDGRSVWILKMLCRSHCGRSITRLLLLRTY